MAKILKIFLLLVLSLGFCSCSKGRAEASRLIEEAQTLRDEGDKQTAKEKLLQATYLAPDFPDVYLELGILMDEYYRDTKEAIPYYEKFLTLCDNPEMRVKVEAWLEDAKNGMALPFEAVNELSPEAKELLDKRTEQFEALRRQLIDRYESELAKLREGVSTVVVTVAETKETVVEQSAAEPEVKQESETETKTEVAVAEKKVEEQKPSKAELKKLEEEKKKEAARLAKEKKEREEKIDAFVRNIVKAGSDAAETTVISASSLPKVPEREAKIELELTEEEEAAPASTNLTAKVEAPAEKKEAAEPPKEKEPRIHVVGQGDNLGNISRKYYGEFKRWKDIAEANKEILPDPNKLKIGMKLVIPE
jgi:Uncharacterized protein containing LysM domain